MSFRNLFFASAFLAASVMSQTVTVTVDGTATGTPLKTVWSWYGYDEANYTNTQPSKDLLQTVVNANREQVFIRTHFLLNTDTGAPGLKWGSTNVYTENAGQPVYYWDRLDSIQDAIVNGGALPYAQIAFTPKAMTSAPSTVRYRNSSATALDGGCFYPPKDYTKWASLITNWAQHSKDRYPNVEQKWVWELWNEPDIGYFRPNVSSVATKTLSYDTLFDYTERALHNVLPNAVLSGPEMASSSNITAFLQHCATGTNFATGAIGTRLDQISFHAKGGTAVVSGHVQMALRNQLLLHRTGFNSVATVNNGQFKSKPIVVGEADPDGCAACPQDQYPADAYRNVPAYGAYEAAMMKHSLTLADSLGVNLRALLAWAWLFNDQPYFRGFRTLSSNGVHKPVLNVFKMLGKLRGNRVPVQSSGALGLAYILNNSGAMRGTQAPDIDGMATKSDSLLQLLMWNYHDDLVQVPAANITLNMKVPATFPSKVWVTHWRMDTTHSNAYTKWLAFGSPQNPTQSQLDTLRKYMQLEMLNPQQQLDVVNGQVSLNFTLPRHGVSLVEVSPTQTVGVNPQRESLDRIVLHAFNSTLEINLNEVYDLKVVDVSGHQAFSANGNGPKKIRVIKISNQ